MAPTTRRRAAEEVLVGAPAAAAGTGRSAIAMRPAAVARWLLHAALAAAFLYVYLWHFTHEASTLPGASGFGLHWRVRLPRGYAVVNCPPCGGAPPWKRPCPKPPAALRPHKW